MFQLFQKRMGRVKSRWSVVEQEEFRDLPTILSSSETQLVKQNRQRTVCKVITQSGEWFVKTCRVDGIRAWFRELFRGPKARLEFRNARELACRGIKSIVPISWSGNRWPSTSQIVTRAVSEGIPLDTFLEQKFSTFSEGRQICVRRQIAKSLARFFAGMYNAGVVHPDPHPGNLLISQSECGEPEFTLLDVHAVRFVKQLPVQTVTENLVLFNRWFVMRTTREDRLRFWHEFSKHFERDIRSHAKDVESRTVASNLRFWARRFKRYVGMNREFRPIRMGQFKGYVVRDWPESTFSQLLKDPDQFLENSNSVVLKSSRSSRVVSFPLQNGEHESHVVFKRIPIRSWLSGLKNCLRPSSVMRSWSNSHSLRDRGLPTPRPLLVFHRYRWGLPCEGYLLVEKCVDSTPLADAVRDLAPVQRPLPNPSPPRGGASKSGLFSPPRFGEGPGEGFSDRLLASWPEWERSQIVHEWATKLGRLLRLMHDRGMAHGDCKAANILMEGTASDPASWEPSFIDLVGATSGLRIGWRARYRDLARLAVSFLPSLHVRHSHRLNFLQSYLSTFPRNEENKKKHWLMIGIFLQEKVKKNKSRNRPLG